MLRDTFSSIKLLGHLNNLTLNVSNDGASTMSLGNLFKCFTTIIAKDFFLIPNNVVTYSVMPEPLLRTYLLLKSTKRNVFLVSCQLDRMLPQSFWSRKEILSNLTHWNKWSIKIHWNTVFTNYLRCKRPGAKSYIKIKLKQSSHLLWKILWQMEKHFIRDCINVMCIFPVTLCLYACLMDGRHLFTDDA